MQPAFHPGAVARLRGANLAVRRPWLDPLVHGLAGAGWGFGTGELGDRHGPGGARITSSRCSVLRK
jgi:hypothetical protein